MQVSRTGWSPGLLAENLLGLISKMQILSNDIGIEFGIKKCGVLVLKRGTVLSSEGVEIR